MFIKLKHQQLSQWADQVAFRAQQQKLVEVVRNTKNQELQKKIRQAIATSNETLEANTKTRMISNPELWNQVADLEKTPKESQPLNMPDKEWKDLILIGEATPRTIIRILLQEVIWPSNKVTKMEIHLKELNRMQIFLLPSIMLALQKHHSGFREAMKNICENQDYVAMDKLLGEKQKKISQIESVPHT